VRRVWWMYLLFYVLGSFFGVQRVMTLFKRTAAAG
jgi:hypothetical protein